TLPEFLQHSMHRERFAWRWDTPAKWQKNVRAYFRMISGVDHAMGRVLDEVERLGLAGDTVVIFAGDNGYYLGSRGFAGKWSHYEESLRVPLIVHDPRLPEKLRGRVAGETVLNVDIPATIVALAGIDVPPSYQGRSLVPLVRGQDVDDWRTDFFCEHLFDHAEIPKWEGVRSSRWVYARYFQQSPPHEFLHDPRDDPGQLRNLAGDPAYATDLARMRRRCNDLRDGLGGEYSPEKFPTNRRPRKARAKRAPPEPPAGRSTKAKKTP
ncbi:MAG: sulfatase-like hydrolase/transferase, partial [Planctomycetota bacterium]|nr:sulfatase-like hydrolase/transferase [Planctomycetota bacterium]